MGLTRITFENFTAFKNLDLELSPGVNVFIGENGTGKTHILKAGYAICSAPQSKDLPIKFLNIFRPYDDVLSNLVHNRERETEANIEIKQESMDLIFTIVGERNQTLTESNPSWFDTPITTAMVPVKEILSNAPGFRSLYSKRNISFSEIYKDIIDLAYLPELRKDTDSGRKRLLDLLQQAMDGRVITEGEHFFLKNRQGNLEFTLLAEGIRKLALLWLLIQNGTLTDASILFWDEPEANLNPKLIRTVVRILLELQRMGDQIFIATHDYVLLKWLDLQLKPEDKIKYHALYREEKRGDIKVSSVDSFAQIHPNAIADTFSELYDQEIAKSLGEADK